MIALALFAGVILLLLLGFPVAFTLAGASLLFAFFGILSGNFDAAILSAVNGRVYGIFTNTTLLAIPLFIVMGVTLQKSRIAENLLSKTSALLAGHKGSLGFAVVIIGALLAASSGIVGATVVTMGLLSLPVMLKQGYKPSLASGIVCASGTLGQIIPPSIALILLGDAISSAYQKSQLEQGIFSPESVSITDLFAGALIPGLGLVALYLAYLFFYTYLNPDAFPASGARNSDLQEHPSFGETFKTLLAPMGLIFLVLGSIFFGVATPTEAASIGATGVLLLAWLQRRLSRKLLKEIVSEATRTSCMVFMILIGATFFSLVFRGYGGDIVINDFLSDLPGGYFAALAFVMLLMFVLGFVLDFIEITLVVVPIVAPALLVMGADPIWLGVLMAINLQTSFLTPPFGFALFYLRGVAPPSIKTQDIYRGSAPFVALQLLMIGILAVWPGLATWLPGLLY